MAIAVRSEISVAGNEVASTRSLPLPAFAASPALLLILLIVAAVESRPCQLQDIVFTLHSAAGIPQDCTELHLFNAEGATAAWTAEAPEATVRKEDQIAMALPSLVNLKRLDCHAVQFGDFVAHSIAKLIGNHAASALTHIHLWDAGITDKGAAVIGKALETADHLKVLSLKGNSIADEGTFIIAEALQVNSVLETLDLSQNLLSDDGGIAVADSLTVAAATSALTDLELSHNTGSLVGLGDRTAASFASVLRKNNVLSSLLLLENSITDVGVGILNTALKENTALQRLEVDSSGNRPGKPYELESWTAMRRALRKRRHGYCSAYDIFRTSSVSTETKGRQHAFATWDATIPWDCATVDLSEHSVTADTVHALSLAAISIATTLTAMFPKVDGDKKKDGGAKKKFRDVGAKESVPLLQKIDLRFCNIGNTGASVLAQAFHNLGPSKVDYIDLRNNHIDRQNALSMITAISTNRDLLLTLKVLYIQDDENLMFDNPHSKRDPREF